jgi:signal transduction histidine kinase
MQQSSNDLTNMVRLYVATGDPQYRRYYNEILAIRAGTAPRPRDYDNTFWDRVLAQGPGFIRYGKRDSLTAQMHAAQFTPAEFAALAASLRASNGLAGVEERVMNAVAPRIRRGVGASYLAEVAPEYHQLVGRGYLVQKGVIMAAVQRFIGVVNRLTAKAVSHAQARSSHLVAAEIAVLEEVAGAFNAMGDAIETDIAAREQAEHEAVIARHVAEHASRAKTTFLAAMSHEIRTPMIGVTGMLEVLERTELTPQQRQMVATAQSSAQSLLLIIGDILDFSKIEADKLELAPSTFAIRPLLRTTVETFVHTASAKGLLLSWSADERIAPAQVGDALRLRQTLSNFISNAVKFTDAGGIEVTAVVTDESPDVQTLEFAVTDTGVGVMPEQQARLFQEFAQAQASTSSSHGGTGLGLVICKRLAILMGGDVTMESVAGSGTTVRLTVPLPIGDPAQIEETGTAGSGALPTSWQPRSAATRRRPARRAPRSSRSAPTSCRTSPSAAPRRGWTTSRPSRRRSRSWPASCTAGCRSWSGPPLPRRPWPRRRRRPRSSAARSTRPRSAP